MPIIHWFRRDLRLADNTALNAAIQASGGEVIPAFILDDALLKGKDVAPARVHFMLDSLRELDANLQQRGSRLVVRRGDVEEELGRLVRETGAGAVYFNRDYTPLARKRDERVTKALRLQGVQVESFKDLVVFEEDELMTGGGKPYTVFTPYKKAWLGRIENAESRIENVEKSFTPLSILNSEFSTLNSQFPIPRASDLGFAVTQDVSKGGEDAAQELLRQFIESHIAEYDRQRDRPAVEGTSRLSPHLRFGTISPRQCFQAAMDAKREADIRTHKGFDVWIGELIWREFYMQVLYHFPHADKGSFKREYDNMRWGSGDAKRDEALFKAWCEGRTGYPIVDAAMRQLNTTAWMHNRARMIVASFLTKDLLLDWRWGESYFMQKLVDGDPASNNGGWQWAASTGPDAQPYFRMFNPTLQGERFDPKGEYIRRYVHELARVPDEYIHEPWTMPPMTQLHANCMIGQDYPKPIVDHAKQKDEILHRFKAIK
jgi:deoxyribodipyrimidine photo-lyase